MTTNTKPDPSTFAHRALFYHTLQEYLDRLVPFVTDGLEAGHPVLVAVPAPNLAALQDALGISASLVELADMTKVGRNPGRILGGVLGSFAGKHPDEPVRMIGEPIWPSRSEAEYPACVQQEALINRALAGRDVTVVCPYDATHLDSGVLNDARHTHPVLWQAGLPEQESPAYAPEAVWDRYNQPLSSSPTAVSYTVNELGELSGLRAFAATYAQWFGLSPDAAVDLQLIATELAASSVQHTGGPCRLALWWQHGYLVCEARDPGYLDDPLAGCRQYDRDTNRGRGLFVVNAVADLVRIHTTSEGTAIHAHLGRAA